MTLGQALRELAESKGLRTQGEIATATGLTQSFISRLFADQSPELTANTVFKLAHGLGVPMDFFAPFVAPGVSVPPPPSAAGASHAPVPLLGVVGAGPAVDEAFAPDTTILVPIHYVGCVAYLVGGDSLIAAHILKGDYVIVRASPDPRPGKIVIAYLDGLGCVVKKLAAGGVLVSSVKGDKWRHKLTDDDCIYGEYVGLERKV